MNASRMASVLDYRATVWNPNGGLPGYWVVELPRDMDMGSRPSPENQGRYGQIHGSHRLLARTNYPRGNRPQGGAPYFERGSGFLAGGVFQGGGYRGATSEERTPGKGDSHQASVGQRIWAWIVRLFSKRVVVDVMIPTPPPLDPTPPDKPDYEARARARERLNRLASVANRMTENMARLPQRLDADDDTP